MHSLWLGEHVNHALSLTFVYISLHIKHRGCVRFIFTGVFSKYCLMFIGFLGAFSLLILPFRIRARKEQLGSQLQPITCFFK